MKPAKRKNETATGKNVVVFFLNVECVVKYI
jgi:hypothetical protein